MQRRRLLTLMGNGLLLASALPRTVAAQDAPTARIVIGVAPNVSTREIGRRYEPLRAYLSAALALPAELVTAPNFKAFHTRTLAGDYSVAITPPHLARIAELDRAANAFAVFEPLNDCLFVESRAAPVADFSILKGRALAFAAPLSLVAIKGCALLSAQGISCENDVRVVRSANDESVAHLVARGEAPLAVMSGSEWRAVPAEIQALVRIRNKFGEVPGFFAVTPNSLSRELREQLVDATFRIFGHPTFGAAFKNASGLTGIRPITQTDLREIDLYVERTRQLLRTPT